MIDRADVEHAVTWLIDFYTVQGGMGERLTQAAIEAVCDSVELTQEARAAFAAHLEICKLAGWSEPQLDSYVNGFLAGLRAAQHAQVEA